MLQLTSGCDAPEFPEALEASVVELSDTAEHAIASQSGPLSSCDAWLHVPASWLSRITLRVYAYIGAARVLVAQTVGDRVPTTVGEDESHSGIAVSVRGRPCEAFELTVQASAGTALEGGRFYLQAWRDAGRPQITAGIGAPAVVTASPLVAATLVARDAGSGDLKEVVIDEEGRLVMGNPLFTDEAHALLDGATASATPSTLALRDESAATSFSRITLVDAAPAGVPGAGTSWLWTSGGRVVAREPNGISDAFTYADASAGATAKLHRKYVGRVTTTTSVLAFAATIPAADLPTSNWSAHVTARIHAYDVQHDEVQKLTREAGVRKTSGTLVVPTQDQVVGTDLTEGAEFNGGIAALSGDIVVYVQHFSSNDARWTAWVEICLVAH